MQCACGQPFCAVCCMVAPPARDVAGVRVGESGSGPISEGRRQRRNRAGVRLRAGFGAGVGTRECACAAAAPSS